MEGESLMPVTIELQALAPWAAILLSALALWRSGRKEASEKTDKKFTDLSESVDARFKESSTRIGVVAGKVELVEDRVAAVEGELRHLPDKDVTHRIELALSDMKAEMRGLSEGVKPLKGMVERVHEALVEKAVG